MANILSMKPKLNPQGIESNKFPTLRFQLNTFPVKRKIYKDSRPQFGYSNKYSTTKQIQYKKFPSHNLA